MRIPATLLALLFPGALSLVSGCASAPRSDTEAQPSPQQVHELNPYVGRSYEIVGRLPFGSWRTAFGLPSYTTKDEAIAAMRTDAARLNADALVSVSCLDMRGSTWLKSNESAFICYGVAIQLRQSQG